MVQPPVIGGDRGVWGQKLIDWILDLTGDSVSQSEIDTLEATVSGNIAAIDAMEADVAAIDTRVGIAETDITALEAADTALDGRLDTAETDIAALEGADTALDGRLDIVETSIIRIGQRSIDLQDPQYGGVGDGTTSNAAAFAAAFADIGAGGATIHGHPDAVYAVPSTLAFPARTVFRGAGKRSTTIKAMSGFTGTHAVSFDDGVTLTFDVRLEHMTLDCNGIAGLSAVKVRTAQEGCGANNISLANYDVYGWDLAVGAANMQWYDMEMVSWLVDPTCHFFVDPSGPAGEFHMERVTAYSDNIIPKAFDIGAGVWTMDSIHVESATDGIHAHSNSSGFMSGIGTTSVATVDKLVRVGSAGWTVAAINKGAATTTLADDVSGVTFTDPFINFWTTTTSAGRFLIGSSSIISGAGSPEGVRTAYVGSIYLREGGGAGTTLYVKESGSGNTGWVAK